jgi:leader peptidase (prepilin peptidase) / N-methyltransferase
VINPIWPVAAALGLCLGSFASVLIHRLPRERGIVRGRSACPRCDRMIAWYDNLPLVSWLLLRGRCRHCRAPISWQYPLNELITALLVLGSIHRAGPGLEAVAVFVFLYLLGVIAVIDARHMIIPHTLTVSGMVLGLVLAEFTGPGLDRALLGLLVGGGSVLLLSEGYRLLRGQAGMGGGDVMLMGMIGAFLGPWPAVAVLGLGALLGTLFVVVRSAGRVEGTARLPFGTFLAAAAVAVLLVGTELWAWYLGLLT